ncbi:MAG: hypothetical protein PVJ33_01970 [Lysobacterales bacterium]|jgi:tetratricopeptide (TPR) repeat protein
MTLDHIQPSRISISAALLLLLLPLSQPLAAATQENADQLFAESEFAAAADAYRELIDDGIDVPRNRFQLGRALHEGGDPAKARDAYLAALQSGFQPEGRVRYHLARAEISLGHTEAALQQLEALARLGSPPAPVLQSAAEFAVLKDEPRYRAVLEALSPCRSPEYHQFDFWLGHWNVTPAGKTQSTAENHIASRQGGCVVMEQYTNGAYSGMSINFYDRATGLWHQSWMDNAGGAVHLQGGLNEAGEMVLSDRDLPVSSATGTVNRVTWTPLPGGEVRQHWESSGDGGRNWKTVFDGIYSPKE